MVKVREVATQEHSRIVPFYRALMSELRDRITWLEYAFNGKMGVPQALLEEFIFLQIRLCCEIIALACVVAHGDIEKARAKRVVKHWSAAQMFLELEKLTADSYPKPFTQERTMHVVDDSEPVSGWHFAERQDDYLTKEELVDLYGKCGDRLHRGRAKNILANRPYKQSDLKELVAVVQKMMNLTAIHRIQMAGAGGQLLCIMYPDGADEVSVMLGYPHERE